MPGEPPIASPSHAVPGAAPPPEPAPDTRSLRPAAACVFALFSVAYWLFVACSRRIVDATPALSPAAVNPWLRDDRIAEHDGVEVYVALAGMLVLVALSTRAPAIAARVPVLRRRWVQAACFLSGALVLARDRCAELVPVRAVLPNVVVVVGGGFAILALRAGWRRAGPRARTAAAALAFALWTCAVVLSLLPPSLADYGYYIGPALKLRQGEPLGSFYVQYDLLGTLLFQGMLWAGLKAHQMQLLLALTFAAWLLLYSALARALFDDGFLALLFLVALVLLRFLAIRWHPTHYPQVSSLRLDLWVPLVLALRRWGFLSLRTSTIFALAYLANSLFGALFLAIYVAMAALASLERARRGPPLALRSWLLPLPILCALALHRSVFGSFLSPAAHHYAQVQLGFLPISPHSLFWAVALGVLAAALELARDPRDETRRVSLFLLYATVAELVYFFGRSHDHNLFNISGIWLLVLFLGLDRMRPAPRRAIPHAAAAALVLFLAVIGGSRTEEKWQNIRDHLARGVLVDPHPIEEVIERHPAWPRRDPRAVTLSMEDAYLNYRLGLRQVLAVSPLEANVFLEDTVRELAGLAASGAHLWSPDGAVQSWVAAFDDAPAVKTSGNRFEAVPAGDAWRIVLARAEGAP